MYPINLIYGFVIFYKQRVKFSGKQDKFGGKSEKYVVPRKKPDLRQITSYKKVHDSIKYHPFFSSFSSF